MDQFTQLGIAGITLGILFFVVKYFIAAMTAKDAQILQMVKDFSLTINNHLAHEQKALEGLQMAIGELTHEMRTARKIRETDKLKTP